MKMSKFGDHGLYLTLAAAVVLALSAGLTMTTQTHAQEIKKNPKPVLPKQRCYTPPPVKTGVPRCATGFVWNPFTKRCRTPLKTRRRL